MKIVLKPKLDANLVRHMELDQYKNFLFLVLKNNDVLVIALIGNSASKTTIIERIKFFENVFGDHLTSFSWLEHLSCYIEGTN